MINGKYRRLPCNCCNDVQGFGRATEKREWQAEIEEELHDDYYGDHEEAQEAGPYFMCDRCFDPIYFPYYHSSLGPDGGTYCKSCVVMYECVYQDQILDLSDPMISVRS